MSSISSTSSPSHKHCFWTTTATKIGIHDQSSKTSHTHRVYVTHFPKRLPGLGNRKQLFWETKVSSKKPDSVFGPRSIPHQMQPAHYSETASARQTINTPKLQTHIHAASALLVISACLHKQFRPPDGESHVNKDSYKILRQSLDNLVFD